MLHPPLLDEIGLLSALRWLADGLRQRSGIKIDLELPEAMERLPPEHELAIFRVAQEALTNVHRHSKSPSVTIRLFEQDDAVILEVEDAGHGIFAGRRVGQSDRCGRVGRRPRGHARADAPAWGSVQRAQQRARNLRARHARAVYEGRPSH